MEVVKKYLPWCRKMAGLQQYRSLDPSDVLSAAMYSVWKAHEMADPGTKPMTLARTIFKNSANDLLRKWFRRRRLESQWPTYESYAGTVSMAFLDQASFEPWQIVSADEEMEIILAKPPEAKPCLRCGTKGGCNAAGRLKHPSRVRGLCSKCYSKHLYEKSKSMATGTG